MNEDFKKTEPVAFVEWVAQNHYVLHNVTKDNCYWRNEDGEKTTVELYIQFLYNKD